MSSAPSEIARRAAPPPPATPAVAVGDGFALIPLAKTLPEPAALPERGALTSARDIIPRMAADIMRLATERGEHDTVTDADLRDLGWSSAQRQLYGAAALRRAAETLKESLAAAAAAEADGGSVA